MYHDTLLPRRQFVLNHSLLLGFDCTWGVFRPAEYIFGDCFGVPRHVDAQETISYKIIVCCSVLTVAVGFSTH